MAKYLAGRPAVITRGPMPYIFREDTLLDLSDCNKFSIENKGASIIYLGAPGQESAELLPGEQIDFATHPQEIYEGSYGIRFEGGTGIAQIFIQKPVLEEREEESDRQGELKEYIM